MHRLTLCTLLILAAGCASTKTEQIPLTVEGDIAASPPPGWNSAGQHSARYVVGVDRQIAAAGNQSATLYSTVAQKGDMGTLKQIVAGSAFRGKRVRFRAMVRHSSVEHWAGLWMRADTPTQQAVAFDNMQNRPLRGTGEWADHQVVLDIPKATRKLHIGVLLIGGGQVWIDDASLEVVGEDVPVTAGRREGFPLQPAGPAPVHPKPQNLDFERPPKSS